VDRRLKDVVNEDFDAVILPGGPGYKKYGEVSSNICNFNNDFCLGQERR
jgi:enhancing lycopene biosynthesis protein 2